MHCVVNVACLAFQVGGSWEGSRAKGFEEVHGGVIGPYEYGPMNTTMNLLKPLSTPSLLGKVI